VTGKIRPNRRQVAAEATRKEILTTARRLFSDHGYANTSIQQIASESGVAIQTIYSSIGSKGSLILALNDLIDEESGVAPLAVDALSETNPAKLLAKGVHITRQINERCGDLIRVLLSAEPSEPEVAIALADGMRRHKRGMEELAGRLASMDALQAGTEPEHAADVLSMMTAPASWRQLTHDAAWTFDDAEAWLTESLTKLLLVRGR
jgi:AcrR family transcriptional regulator